MNEENITQELKKESHYLTISSLLYDVKQLLILNLSILKKDISEHIS